MRTQGTRGAVVVAALALGSACGGSRQDAPAPAVQAGNGYNVLLLTIDTLRADHLGAYGYPRPTSPAMDALAAQGTLFEQAYTHWPKTRGSFVSMLTGRYASVSGYSKHHPMLLDHNPTLASVLAEAGYRTLACVDNPNVAASLGYAKGFERYRETWEERALATEMDRTRAITRAALDAFAAAAPEQPFFLWLHYVNPHTPYTPPSPYDTAFVDDATRTGPALDVVRGLHGGIPEQWAVDGEDRLGYYVAQYDGEIAVVDREVDAVLKGLDAAGLAGNTVVVLSSDHGESLGEHEYFFDHGENLFDPSMRVPLIVRVPGGAAGVRSPVLASTLDIVPTILDAVKVSYPPELAGHSLLEATRRGPDAARRVRRRLYGHNDRNLSGGWDARYKVVATPRGEGTPGFALFDRAQDPGETRDASAEQPEVFAPQRDAVEGYLEARQREWIATQRRLQGHDVTAAMSAEACENLKALGYVVAGCG